MLVLCEKSPPSGDRESVRDDSSADSARLVSRMPAAPPEDGGDGHPPPVRELATKTQMDQPEKGRREQQGHGPAPRPVFDPLLQDAAKEEFFGKRDDPEEAEKGPGDAPQRRGRFPPNGVKGERQRQPHGHEVQVM